MQIQIFSDIHLEGMRSPAEIWNFVTPLAPVAVIAGDVDARRFELAVNEIATRFERVLVVLGNHEFYHKSISWRPDAARLSKNVTLLDRAATTHDGVRFIGATLWSDFNAGDPGTMLTAKARINDFRLIAAEDSPTMGKILSPLDARAIHKKDKAFIASELERPLDDGQRRVVITHFLPSYRCINPRRISESASLNLINHYFVGACDDLLPRADLWITGHSHDAVDAWLDGTRVVSNPLGYRYENPGFKDKVVTI